MTQRHALLVRFTPANYAALQWWAKSRGVNLTAALNMLVSNLADMEPPPEPNSVRVSPEKPPVKRKIDYAAVVAEWADVPDADAPEADADDDDLPNFGS